MLTVDMMHSLLNFVFVLNVQCSSGTSFKLFDEDFLESGYSTTVINI
jgi:hypothetical protein